MDSDNHFIIQGFILTRFLFIFAGNGDLSKQTKDPGTNQLNLF